MQSKFFAYLSRLRWIKRWGLKRNIEPENVMEHSWEVATIAHALAIIKNRHFNGQINPEKIATAALYHDASEVITGDLPTPIKYHSPMITESYHKIERQAVAELIKLLPQELQADYHYYVDETEQEQEVHAIIKAADTLSAYLKCQYEVDNGNREFSMAIEQIKTKLQDLQMPEVEYFLDVFVSSYEMTLDDLLKSE
ncbi:MAG: 5'-deoxynucleotidase [gamma proteobacterium symbiont of Bathyaustriella thionipta]|nr:5'-deoxynucleotidase [gamma proteobacterium symbiont of Bathyaustriella thionipta]MCU7951251.1 5'-deoxynucleotidase [gamma proteobacterium symbiont of Bathyaustriella thionipta]MCU7952541.1 5'-deoxynucleotidase [gamma proteobacterium symbiont of Bathyaustriella thionipta]MCU7957779.1 5'-deoxynucleotidase [gamma proteobacterium symbiont of Bathyaustriella thionipta]MCU7967368.1 5'-deoxynucleotidase [gamma proteobacterium symbiont of Bathyaustriella thionipta]